MVKEERGHNVCLHFSKPTRKRIEKPEKQVKIKFAHPILTIKFKNILTTFDADIPNYSRTLAIASQPKN